MVMRSTQCGGEVLELVEKSKPAAPVSAIDDAGIAEGGRLSSRGHAADASGSAGVGSIAHDRRSRCADGAGLFAVGDGFEDGADFGNDGGTVRDRHW